MNTGIFALHFAYLEQISSVATCDLDPVAKLTEYLVIDLLGTYLSDLGKEVALFDRDHR